MAWSNEFSKWAAMVYQQNGESKVTPVMFTYSSSSGSKVSMATKWEMPRRLKGVLLQMNGIGIVRIDELVRIGSVFGFGGLYEHTYSSSECVELDYEGLGSNELFELVTEIYLPIDYREEYIGDRPWSQEFDQQGKGVSIHAGRKTRLTGMLREWNAELELELATTTNGQVDKGITVEPLATFIVRFNDAISKARALKFVDTLMAWNDFLSLQPLSGICFTLGDGQRSKLRYHRKDRVKYRMKHAVYPPAFAIRIEKVLEHYGDMLGQALTLAEKSRAWDELVLLLVQPTLPFRERLFTALRTFEGWSLEQDLAKGGFEDQLKAYMPFWTRYGVSDLGKYLRLVQNTRNDIGHLTKSKKPVLREADQWRLNLELIAILRASVLEYLGMPKSLVFDHFDAMIGAIRERFGIWEPDSYEIKNPVSLSN